MRIAGQTDKSQRILMRTTFDTKSSEELLKDSEQERKQMSSFILTGNTVV